MSAHEVKEEALKSMLQTGSINELILKKTENGFVLEILAGMSRLILITQKNKTRYFKRLEGADNFLHRIGAGRYCVEDPRLSA